MHKGRFSLIATFLLLVALVGGLGWTTYRAIRQHNLNRALFAAIYDNHPDTAMRLLEEGADANARDNGNQPVRLSHGLIDLFNRLRRNNPASQQKGGPTPLMAMFEWHMRSGFVDSHLNIDHKATELLSALLDKGADVNVRDKDGDSPLFLASAWGYTSCVRRLVDKGAKVNMSDSFGDTALIIAALNGYPEIVGILLKAGADPNVKHDGICLLTWAKLTGKTETVSLLKQAGAKE